MPIRHSSYDEASDDIYKDIISELEQMLACEEEDGCSPNKLEGIEQCIKVVTDMRHELYG